MMNIPGMPNRYFQPQEYIDMLTHNYIGALADLAQIDQILGKALGYPLLCEDQEEFPGSTEADGVITGEHTPVTLALEAAARIKELESQYIL